MRLKNPINTIEIEGQNSSGSEMPVGPAREKEFSTIFSPGRSVVLVGNGFSASKGNRGKRIDEFDVVVRFNRFELTNYQEQVGARTDVWCRNQGLYGGTPEIAIRSGARAVLLASEHDRRDRHQRIIAELRGKFANCEVISREIWARVRAAMGGVEPSSGMLAITHVHGFVSPVYTVGFDCMEAGQHHYFEAGEGSAYHPPEVEAGYFRELLRSGSVIELN